MIALSPLEFDLFDVLTLQGNWGEIIRLNIGANDVTLEDLLDLFGYSGGNDDGINAPSWLNMLLLSCF